MRNDLASNLAGYNSIRIAGKINKDLDISWTRHKLPFEGIKPQE
jgi:hypothetical protein